jgi:predicted ATPase
MLFPLGPFRRPPERWYIFTGTSPQDVGYRGELLPDLLFRNPSLIDEANNWLERLNVGYRLKVEQIGPRVKDLFEVRLVDTRRKDAVEVGLSDVGYGISQILPFIVQSLSSSNNIITIEQPEVHIHPRLQADLGDLLAEAIKKHNNQFVVETHSEHLVLRLQRLIRDRLIKPSDVAIIFVSRCEFGAKAERLRLDENGDFVDDWPGGFFPERLRELR